MALRRKSEKAKEDLERNGQEGEKGESSNRKKAKLGKDSAETQVKTDDLLTSIAIGAALEKISPQIMTTFTEEGQVEGILILFQEDGFNGIVSKIQDIREEWAERTEKIRNLFHDLDKHWAFISENVIDILETNSVEFESDSVTNMLIAFQPSLEILKEIASLPEVVGIKGPTWAYYDDDDFDDDEEEEEDCSGESDFEDDEEEEEDYSGESDFDDDEEEEEDYSGE